MTAADTTRLVALEVPGPVGRLEALMHERESGTHALTVLVLHPHPSYGGTMHNKVVHRVASTLHARGAAVLRFNYRGVGKSEGTFDHGRGELEDARAALAFLRDRHPAAPAWVAGFSFGAWIATRLVIAERAIERLIVVAPPVKRSDFSALETLVVPKLVIQGTADTVCPIDELEAAFPGWAEPKTLVQVEGATHFFDRRLAALDQALVEGLAAAMPSGTSRDA